MDMSDPPQRKIIHVDMDAFFASVEQRDNPELRGKPVAVGGSSLRGVVAAASYEARKYGVHSAMPSVTAKRKCPDLIFVKHRFEVYREVSQQIRAIFAEYTPLIEPLSLDEAYLDVTENIPGIASATQIATEIRTKIAQTTHLTASAGVSYNKFLAKLASDQNKPDGLCVIKPSQGPDFVAQLSVKKFHGVGPATAAKMNRLGLYTGLDIRNQTIEFLRKNFGTSGSYYYGISRGICHRPVRPDHVRKSVGGENTFFTDVDTLDLAWTELEPIIDKVWRHIDKNAIRGRTVTLKVKYSDFTLITRSRSQPHPVAGKDEFISLSRDLLEGIFPSPKTIRLLGITLSSLGDHEVAGEDTASQLSLMLGDNG